MNLPLRERFTSVQKDDLKAALGKAAGADSGKDLSTHVARELRETLNEHYSSSLDADDIDAIVDSVATDIMDYGPDDPDFATDEAVQAVEDFLCI